MKKLLFSFLFLIVGFIAAVLAASNFINWNEYRDVITDEINAATGFNLEIHGDIKISILPSPALLINKIHVANIEGATRTDMLAVDSFEVRVALTPLLGGQLQIRSVKLVKPILSLEVLADGRTNMAFKAPNKESSGQKSNPAQAVKKDNRALPFGSLTGQASEGSGDLAIQVDDFVIEKGSVFYRDDTNGQVESVENLNGRFALSSLSGPMESSGSVVIRGVPMSFVASAGTMIQGRTLPFNFSLKVIPGETSFQFSGALTRLNENPQVKGKLKVAGQNLASFVSAITGGASLPDSLALPFGADAVIAGEQSGGTVSDLQVKLNGTQGSGKIAVKFAKLMDVKIQMAVNKLDIDALLASPKASTKPNEQKKSKAKGAPKTISPITKTFNAGQKKTKDAPFSLKDLPEDINVDLNLSVAAITYKDAVIRQAKINSTLANREVTISQASALLPGSTDVALFGFISEAGGAKTQRPTFDGNVDLATNDLRGLLDWAGIDVSDIAKDRLRKLTIGSKIVADAKSALLKEITINIDSSKIKGAANIAFRQRPSFGVYLSIDRFNLDAYLPQDNTMRNAVSAVKKSSARATQPAAKSSPASTPVLNPLAALAPLGEFDANITIDLKSLTVQKFPIKGLNLDTSIFDGKLTVKEFRTANAAGITINVSGNIDGLKKSNKPIDPAFKNFKFNLRGKSLARLFSLAKFKPPVSAGQLGAVRLSGKLNGKPHALNVTTNTAMLEGKFTFNGVVRPLMETPSVDGEFSTNHPNLMKLLRRLGSTYRPSGKITGGINLRGRIAGNAQLMAFSKLAGKAAGINLQGSAAMDLSRARPIITANLKTGPIVIDDLLPAKRTAHRDQKLREFEYTLWNSQKTPKLVQASFSRAPKNLATPMSMLKVVAKSGAPWSNDPIDLAFLKSFDGNIQLQSDSLRFQKYLVSSVNLATALDSGIFDLQRLTGNAYGGDIKIDGRVIAGDKRNQFQTRFNIAGFDAGTLLQSLGTKGFQRGALDMVGEFRTLGRSTVDLVRELGGGGTISVRGLDLSSAARHGSALSGIAGLFLSLNQFGNTLTHGKTSSKSADFRTNFKMAKGVARFDDMSLASGLGAGLAKGTIDLPNWRISTVGEIELSQNILAQLLQRNSSKQPVLPFNISGRLDNPKVKLETAALTKGGIRLPGSISKKLDKLRKKKGVGAILDQIFPQAKSGSTGSSSSPNSGAPPPQSPPPQHVPQQQKPKVEDFLKGILKGLGR